MDQHPDIDKPARAGRWRAQVTMTIAAWLIAFLIVFALSTFFKDQLASLPLPLRALVLSGILVALMVNLVMPLISAALVRRLPPLPDTRPVERGSPPSETSSIGNPSGVEPNQ